MNTLPEKLSTTRLVLRRVEHRDVPAIVRGLNNWNVARWLGRVPHPYVARHARGWVAFSRKEWDAGRDLTLVIIRRGGPDRVIGAVGAHNLHQAEQPCGYWLAEPHWGKGYVSEAFAAVLTALFDIKLDARPVATALTDNPGSINVLHKAGFVREFRHSSQINLARRRKARVLHFTYPCKGAVYDHAQEPSMTT